MDYGNAVFAGIPSYLVTRLQSVMNAAARLVFSSSRFDHITPLLCQLHWLKATKRIDFKLAVLVYKYLHETAPSYLADELCQSADLNNLICLMLGTQSCGGEAPARSKFD